MFEAVTLCRLKVISPWCWWGPIEGRDWIEAPAGEQNDRRIHGLFQQCDDPAEAVDIIQRFHRERENAQNEKER